MKEQFPLNSVVQWETFGTGVFALFALGFFLLGLTTLLSSMDRYRWRTIGAVMSIYVVQLVMFGLGKAADQLSCCAACPFSMPTDRKSRLP